MNYDSKDFGRRRIIIFDPRNYILPVAYMSNYSRSTTPSMVDTIKKGDANKENMVDRILNQYGHNSVAELNSIQLGLEGVSNIAVNDIEKSRVGVSFLEKSSRYIDFTKEGFRYYTPKEIAADEELLNAYVQAYDLAKETYKDAFDVLEPIVIAENPITSFMFHDSTKNKSMPFEKLKSQKDIDDAISLHKSSVREYVLDNISNMLPSGIITNVAMNINFRSFRDMLSRLESSNVIESNELGRDILEVIKPYSDKLIKKRDNSYRKKQNNLYDAYTPELRSSVITVYKNQIENYYADFITEDDEEQQSVVTRQPKRPIIRAFSKPLVTNSLYNDGILNEAILCAAIITEFDDVTTEDIGFARILDYFNDDENDSKAQKRYLIENYGKNRETRNDKIGISTEMIDFVFEIESSYRTFRDLRRHRTLTRISDKVITTKRGYFIPPEFHKNRDLVQKYLILNRAFNDLYDLVLKKTKNYYLAQYCTLLGHVIKYTVKMNLRQLITLIELRSDESGHWEYRNISHQIYEHLRLNSELLASLAKFVNLDRDIKLGRLKQNIRTMLKNKELTVHKEI